MKLISLVGSPHGEKGNTAKLTKEVLKGAESMGAMNETIVLKGESPCQRLTLPFSGHKIGRKGQRSP